MAQRRAFGAQLRENRAQFALRKNATDWKK
jgi:hypothetical protein